MTEHENNNDEEKNQPSKKIVDDGFSMEGAKDFEVDMSLAPDF